MVDALALCRRLHAGQTRWGTDEPYSSHPERVADIVGRSPEYRDAPDVVRQQLTTVALLHDAIEDTDYSLDQARADFGVLVAEALDRLTHREGETYYSYIRHVRNSDIARVVKRADIADNLSTLPFDRDRLWYKYVEALKVLA